MEKKNNRTQFISFCCEMVEKYGLSEETEMKYEDNGNIVKMEEVDTGYLEEYVLSEQEKVGGGC